MAEAGEPKEVAYCAYWSKKEMRVGFSTKMTRIWTSVKWCPQRQERSCQVGTGQVIRRGVLLFGLPLRNSRLVTLQPLLDLPPRRLQLIQSLQRNFHLPSLPQLGLPWRLPIRQPSVLRHKHINLCFSQRIHQ